MSMSAYGGFLGFATVLVLIPGPDFAVVTKNTLAGGRRRGWFTAAGVCTSNAIQGAVAVSGLSAIILKAQLAFAAIKWAGVCYLAVLGIRSLASAARGRYDLPDDEQVTGRRTDVGFGGWRQGFLSNITNPKVLIFYIAVLPQFMKPGAAPGWLLAFAWSHAALSLLYLMALSTGLARARTVLSRRWLRRTMDGATGMLLLGFSARLAAEHGQGALRPSRSRRPAPPGRSAAARPPRPGLRAPPSGRRSPARAPRLARGPLRRRRATTPDR